MLQQVMAITLLRMVTLYSSLGMATGHIIDERADDFAFNITSNKATPYFTLGLESDPPNLLNIEPMKYTKHADGVEEYNYHVVCNERVSYRIKVMISLNYADDYYC